MSELRSLLDLAVHKTTPYQEEIWQGYFEFVKTSEFESNVTLPNLCKTLPSAAAQQLVQSASVVIDAAAKTKGGSKMEEKKAETEEFYCEGETKHRALFIGCDVCAVSVCLLCAKQAWHSVCVPHGCDDDADDDFAPIFCPEHAGSRLVETTMATSTEAWNKGAKLMACVGCFERNEKDRES